MSSLFTKRSVFSERVVGISMGVSHVFLSVLLSPLIFFGVRTIESVMRSYTGYTLNLAFSGEVRAQMVVLILVSLVSIAVATLAFRGDFYNRSHGGIARYFSIATMVVISWSLVLWLSGGARNSYGNFSREALATLFAILPVLHFFLLRFLVRKVR